MKILSIGDIHGRDNWKSINFQEYDKIVFIGDYVDSYYLSCKIILDNLLDIIQFKKDNLEKVILLLGNHDIQYLWNPQFRCSGFKAEMIGSYDILFRENRDLFQVAYQYKNYLWTHAGVSNSWYNYYEDKLKCIENETLADRFNDISNSSLNYILHEVGAIRGGMRYNNGGITWADRSETKTNYLKEFHQIVGHTPITEITTFGDEKSSITYIDVAARKHYELNIEE